MTAPSILPAIRSPTIASPAPLLGALTLLHFCLPALFTCGMPDLFADPRSLPYLPAGLLLVGSSYLAFLLGAAWAERAGNMTRREPTVVHWSTWNVLVITVPLLVLGWLTRAFFVARGTYFQIDRTDSASLPEAFAAFLGQFELFPSFAGLFVLLAFLGRGRPLRRHELGLVTALYGLELVYWIPTGRKEQVLWSLLQPLLAAVLLRKRALPLAALLGLLAITAILVPAAYYYRLSMETTGQQQSVMTAINSALEGGVDQASKSRDPAWMLTLRRFNLAEPVAACVRLIETGTWQPLLGASYLDAITGLVPRLLWPDKPSLHYGNEFGYEGGFISATDTRTSISVTFIGESYLNFRWVGSVMFVFLGWTFSRVWQNSQSSPNRQTWVLVYLVMLPSLMYLGGTFAMYIGGLFKTVPFYYVLGRLAETRVA